MFIELGNTKPIAGVRNDKDEVEFSPVEGEHPTYIEFPEGTGYVEALRTVRDLWAYHSARGDDGHVTDPAWVESDDEAFQALVAGEFNCKSGCPKGWKGGRHPLAEAKRSEGTK